MSCEKSLRMKVNVAGIACIEGIFVQHAFDDCHSIDIIAPCCNCLKPLRTDSESPLLAIKKFLVRLPRIPSKLRHHPVVFANRVRPIRSWEFPVGRSASLFMVNDWCTNDRACVAR
jgi:hypothetical protein